MQFMLKLLTGYSSVVTHCFRAQIYLFHLSYWSSIFSHYYSTWH